MLNSVEWTSTGDLAGFSAIRVDSGAGYRYLVDYSVLGKMRLKFPSGFYMVKGNGTTDDWRNTDSESGYDKTWETPGNYPNGTAANDNPYEPPSNGNCICMGWNYNAADPTINGFEIINYVGDDTNNRALAHRLGKTPSMYWLQGFSGATLTYVKHEGFQTDSGLLYLNTTQAESAGSFNNRPDENNIYLANGTAENRAPRDYTAYLWSEIPGFSSFGTWQGNGDVDGPYINCGFKPAVVIWKNITTGGPNHNWFVTTDLQPNGTNRYIEFSSKSGGSTTDLLDIYSTGHKIRSTSQFFNIAGDIYIYAAFARNPLGGPGVHPTTAG